VGDVVLYRGDQPAAVVEIHHRHGVSAAKATRLGLPWLELEATEVLERPWWWVARQDGLLSFSCSACEGRARAGAEELATIRACAEQAAAESGQALPPMPPYDAAPHACWRCGAEMAVFVWPGGGGHAARRPPEPVPPTVQWKVSEGWGGGYWANCCPRCSAMQGDHHLRSGNADYARVYLAMGEAHGWQED